MMEGVSDIPLVSVLIPSYNHQAYITKCLQSIIEDGYPRLEVVLIDDGSKDNTYAIACSWLEEHKNCFESIVVATQVNSGICKTLNKLVEHANGDYLAILASDDYLLANGIATRIRILEDNPGLLAVFGDCIVVDENGNMVYRSGIKDLYGGDVRFLGCSNCMKDELLWNWCVPGPVLLVRKSCFDDNVGIGKYNEALLVEDRDFYLKLIKKDAIGFVSDKVSAYRLHGTNTFSQPDYKRQIALADSMVKILNHHQNDMEGLDKISLKLEMYRYATSVKSFSRRRNAYYRIVAFLFRKLKPLVYSILIKPLLLIKLYKIL